MSAQPPEAVPTYKAVLPPSVVLDYDFKRGGFSGSGTLTWRVDGQRYESSLDAKIASFRVMTWRSQGTTGSAGIVPSRFTDQRRGREPIAADFLRDRKQLTYSARDAVFPLVTGSQDRLSWMIQVGAIVAALPPQQQRQPRVAMWVTGARGDYDLWAFKGEGVSQVVTPAGTVRALKLVREPRKPNDTRVEVWLDTARHHLPVRARLSSQDGDSLELALQAVRSSS